MAFTALATKVYKDPVTVQWANSLKQNDDQLYLQVAKAFVIFDASAAPPTILKAFNVSSVEDSGVGIYRVVFSSGFATAPVVVFGSKDQNNQATFGCALTGTGIGSGSVSMRIGDADNNLRDPNQVCLVVFGDE